MTDAPIRRIGFVDTVLTRRRIGLDPGINTPANLLS